MRVTCIFTGTKISPSLLPRQRPNHYAFRAGQNLPDKEFRYLRTVIVTAAVHWGFDSMLAHLLLTFQHRAGVTPYTSSCDFAESCVLVKQLLGPLHCGSFERPFLRTYGAILPSSLATVLSLTSGFSPCPPVSVLVRAAHRLALEAFLESWHRRLRYLARAVHSPSRLQIDSRICLTASYLAWSGIHLPVRLAFFVTPSLDARVQEYQPVFHRLRFSASP